MKLTHFLKKIFCISNISVQHYFFIFAVLIFSSICLAGRLPRSIVLFALSCTVCSYLILLCKDKIKGGLYLLLAIIICNFPAFLIQKSLGKDYAYGNTSEFFCQSSFFFCWIICAYVFNVFVQSLKFDFF